MAPKRKAASVAQDQAAIQNHLSAVAETEHRFVIRQILDIMLCNKQCGDGHVTSQVHVARAINNTRYRVRCEGSLSHRQLWENRYLEVPAQLPPPPAPALPAPPTTTTQPAPQGEAALPGPQGEAAPPTTTTQPPPPTTTTHEDEEKGEAALPDGRDAEEKEEAALPDGSVEGGREAAAEEALPASVGEASKGRGTDTEDKAIQVDIDIRPCPKCKIFYGRVSPHNFQ